jgi:hypothetical protein
VVFRATVSINLSVLTQYYGVLCKTDLREISPSSRQTVISYNVNVAFVYVFSKRRSRMHDFFLLRNVRIPETHGGASCRRSDSHRKQFINIKESHSNKNNYFIIIILHQALLVLRSNKNE